MPLLYYWRGDNYRRDLDMGAGYHLNQANPLLLTLSRYFRVDHQPGVEQIIRQLSCRANAAVLGHAFQGFAAVREISAADHQILTAFAKGLALEPRARLLPEEKLEATLLLEDENAVESLILEEVSGIAEPRQEYLFKQAPIRNKALARQLQELYDGRCQICLWNPQNVYSEYLCQSHHIHWLSRGGEDTLENMMLVCPNHHAAIHKCDAPFDYENYAYAFQTFTEILQINLHLRF